MTKRKKKLLIVGDPNSRMTKRLRRLFDSYEITVVDENNDESLQQIRGMDFDSLIVNEVEKIKHLIG